MQLFKQPGGDSIRGRLFAPEPAPVTEAPEPLWQPTQAPPPRASSPVIVPNERDLLAVCNAPIDPADGHRVGNEKKEQQLVSLFDRLSSSEALALHKRLANPQIADELAMAFEHRLSIERRKRLLAYLGSAKRRAALGR